MKQLQPKLTGRNICLCILAILVVFTLRAVVNGESLYRERLWLETAYGQGDTPVVASGMEGTISRSGQRICCRGEIFFVLGNLPEEQGAVQQVRLYRYVDGEETSSRIIYTPWRNVLYTLRNGDGGIACRPHIFSFAARGSLADYWVEAVMEDGTVYRNYVFQWGGEEPDLSETNLRTEVYNAQGQFLGTIPRPGEIA